MITLSNILPGANLFGGCTVQVYKRKGSGGRFHPHTMDFDAGREADAYAFAWQCDRDILITKADSFITQATSGMSFRWHSQQKWITAARPLMHDVRGYLAQMQRGNVAPEVMAQYANLFATALKASKPYDHIKSAVVLWHEMYQLCTAFYIKYHAKELTETTIKETV